MALPTLHPIHDDDLPEFCRFLTEHLSAERSAQDWAQAFLQGWCADKPNNGFLLRHEGRIVGGIGAIYAERMLRGRAERFCNITSWCVLDEFRTQSGRLAMAVVSQPGWHFTDLTPTEVVSRTLQFFKFKPMDERHLVWPNLPWPGVLAGVRVATDPEHIAALLAPDDARTFRDHRHLPWLRHLAVGRGDAWCHVVWRTTRLKNLTGAMVLAFSDAELFLRHRMTLASHLLLRHGMPFTRVEARLLPRLPRPALELAGYRNKVFRSETLQPADISNLYSELVALDLS
ncbi:MAG: hypothetical protein HYZ20_03030 [Burkholderiales bacterium]|nr:hypothetical protein [Burkholderiales bacterium]